MARSRATEDDDLVVIEDGFKPVEEILAEAGIDGGGGPTRWGSSFWARAKRCPYDGLLIHRDGMEPARSQALVVGILFHAALALWYRSRDRAQALAVCQAILGWCQTRLAEGPATWPSELWGYATLTQNLVVSYLATWQAPPEGARLTLADLERYDPPASQVVLVEHPLGIEPPQSKFPVSGRIDLACIVQDEQTGADMGVIVDTKTTRHETPEWLEAWWQDDQLCSLFYLWQRVLEPLGWPKVGAVVINMVEKPRSRNDLPNFKRHVFKLRPDRIRVWERQMEFAWEEFARFRAAAMVDNEVSWQNVRQNWSACFGRRYSVCPRLDHCITLRDMTVYARPATVAPLLEPLQVPVASTPPAVSSRSSSLPACSQGTQVVQPSSAAAPPLTLLAPPCDSGGVAVVLLSEPASPQSFTADTPPAGASPAATPAPLIAEWQIAELTELAAKTGLPPTWKPTTYESLCNAVFTIYGRPITDITEADATQLIALLEAAPVAQTASPSAPLVQERVAPTAAKPLADEPITKDQRQLDALEKARLKAGWTVKQVTDLALDMFGNSAASSGSLTVTREQMKALILQVLDATSAAPADDLVQLELPVEQTLFESIAKQLADLTNGATSAIMNWLPTAPEPALREYAARFPGQGERFNNLKDVASLRLEIAKVTLDDVQAQLAARQAPSGPAELTVADIIGKLAGKKWKVVGFNPKRQVPVTEAVTENWYLVRGLVGMATPQRTATERTFILDSGVALGVGFMRDSEAPNLAVPADVIDEALGGPPVVDPNAAPQSEGEPGLPRQVGEAAKPTGVVKVFWLGHHKRSAKAKNLFQSVWKEHGDSFGLAFCGKSAETAKLKAFTFNSGVAVETTAKTVGAATWEHFGTLVQGL